MGGEGGRSWRYRRGVFRRKIFLVDVVLVAFLWTVEEINGLCLRFGVLRRRLLNSFVWNVVSNGQVERLRDFRGTCRWPVVLYWRWRQRVPSKRWELCPADGDKRFIGKWVNVPECVTLHRRKWGCWYVDVRPVLGLSPHIDVECFTTALEESAASSCRIYEQISATLPANKPMGKVIPRCRRWFPPIQ